MVRSKYTYEKRQKEIARHKKQEEKAARRAEAKKAQIDQEQELIMEDEASPEQLSDPGH